MKQYRCRKSKALHGSRGGGIIRVRVLAAQEMAIRKQTKNQNLVL